MSPIVLLKLLSTCLIIPIVWSDGSCVTDDLAEVSVAGAGVFSEESGMAWSASCCGSIWMTFSWEER